MRIAHTRYTGTRSLRSLPPELGLMTTLRSIPLDGNPLKLVRRDLWAGGCWVGLTRSLVGCLVAQQALIHDQPFMPRSHTRCTNHPRPQQVPSRPCWSSSAPACPTPPRSPPTAPRPPPAAAPPAPPAAAASARPLQPPPPMLQPATAAGARRRQVQRSTQSSSCTAGACRRSRRSSLTGQRPPC
jgi:hypothetical protein